MMWYFEIKKVLTQWPCNKKIEFNKKKIIVFLNLYGKVTKFLENWNKIERINSKYVEKTPIY